MSLLKKFSKSVTVFALTFFTIVSMLFLCVTITSCADDDDDDGASKIISYGVTNDDGTTTLDFYSDKTCTFSKKTDSETFIYKGTYTGDPKNGEVTLLLNIPGENSSETTQTINCQTNGIRLSTYYNDHDIILYKGGVEPQKYMITYIKNAPREDDKLVTITGSMQNSLCYEGVKLTLNACKYQIKSDSGFAFCGWATSETGDVEYSDRAQITITKNLNLYAVWKKGFAITFNKNDEFGDTYIDVTGVMGTQFFALDTSNNVAKSVNQALTKCAYSATGYKFLGWAKNYNSKVADYTDGQNIFITQNTTLYAIWQETAYVISFDDEYGKMDSVVCEKGKSVKLPKCTLARKDYIFTGWANSYSSTTKAYSDEETFTPEKSITLYPLWKKAKFTISFRANYTGATCTMQSVLVNNGDNVTLPQCTLTREGYEFLGWATSSLSTTKVYNDKAQLTPTGDLTLYALWKRIVDPLKINNTELTSTKNFSFDDHLVSSVDGVCAYTFIGFLTKDDFINIMAATKTATNGLSLDFSGCTGDNFTVTDGSYNNKNYLTGENSYSSKNEKLTSVTLPACLTKIPAYAFAYCSALTNVTITSGSTSIGDNAFYFCDKLTNVTIPSSVTKIGEYAFSSCDKLSNITIPNSVTTIGSSAFSYCDSLTTITIPASVTSLGESFGSDDVKSVFSGSGLTAITVASDNKKYSSSDGAIYNKAGTKLLYCPSKKTSITFISGVTEIGEYAFSNYSGKTITIPNTITKIGNSAFYFSDLTSVTIPDSVTNIGQDAFSNSDLASVTIGAGVASIGDDAFGYCNSLAIITVSSSNTNYSSDSNVLFNKNKTKLIRYAPAQVATTYSVSTSVTNIEKNAFSYAKKLTAVFIPNSVTTITTSTGDYGYLYSPFSNCSSTLIIKCQAASKPAGFGSQWNYYASGNELTTQYNKSSVSE